MPGMHHNVLLQLEEQALQLIVEDVAQTSVQKYRHAYKPTLTG